MAKPYMGPRYSQVIDRVRRQYMSLAEEGAKEHHVTEPLPMRRKLCTDPVSLRVTSMSRCQPTYTVIFDRDSPMRFALIANLTTNPHLIPRSKQSGPMSSHPSCCGILAHLRGIYAFP